MINALQILVRIPLLSVNYPGNVQMCFSILIDITTFNLVSTGSLDNMIFKFSETNGFNANFDALGYNSMNSIENL